MRRPPDKRKGAPGGSGPSSKIIGADSNDNQDHSLSIFVSQLLPRPIGPGELAELRLMWWRQARLGHRMPAEVGVIVVKGGAA